jgi:hypothetical protein
MSANVQAGAGIGILIIHGCESLHPTPLARPDSLLRRLASRKRKILHQGHLIPNHHVRVRKNNIVNSPKLAWIVPQSGVSFPH